MEQLINDLMLRYTAFINWYDPYNVSGDEIEQDPARALNNLKAIYKDLDDGIPDDRELVQARIRIRDLFLSFKAAGFKVAG